MEFKNWISGLDRVYINHHFYGKETVGEFLNRHKIKLNSQGEFILYHGRPKGSKYNELKIGTKLAFSPEDARHFAARDRNLNPNTDIEVLPLTLTPDQIDPGIFVTLRNPYKIKQT